MNNKRVWVALRVIGIAVLVGVVLMIISAFPPLVYIRDWLENHNLKGLWIGTHAAIIAMVLRRYLRNDKNDNCDNEDKYKKNSESL